jgi:uncharacterized protein (TIGR00369 family)
MASSRCGPIGDDSINCEVTVNTDQALLKRYLAHPHTELAIDSNPLAIALRARLLGRDDGTLRMGFEPSREFVQGNGVVQGGIVAAMLDLVAAFTSLATLRDGQTAATVSMAISFLAPVPVGALIATGTVERGGRRLIFARAQLEGAGGGTLLASANTVMSVLDVGKTPHRRT